MRAWLRLPLLLLAALSGLAPLRADAVRDGNAAAKRYAAGDDAVRAEERKAGERSILSFRGLEILEIQNPAPSGRGARLVTREPESKLQVVLLVNTPLSLKLLDGLKKGDAVAAQGRVVAFGQPANTILVDPAQLRHKEKPKG
jgi:hypothetical protein